MGGHLRTLADYRRDTDMVATDTMMELQRRFSGALGALLQALDDAVAAIDFERAMRLCNEIIASSVPGQGAIAPVLQPAA